MANEERVELLEQRLQALEQQVAGLGADDNESGDSTASIEVGTKVAGLAERMDFYDARHEEMMARLESLADEVVVLKRALRDSGGHSEGRKTKVPNPSPYAGVRNAKELENFLFDMEQYFRAAHTPESEMITISCMHLVGDAKLWWRTRVEDATRPRITTWEQMKADLREQFLPCNVAWQARESLRGLKHVGSVREYVKAFQSLMLNVKNMSEDDKLFNFMAGLQSWAQTELRRKGVNNLTSAVAAAEGLGDYKGTSEGSERKQASKDKGKAKEGHEGKPEQSSKYKRSNLSCFICKGPHMAKDCPKKQVASLVAEDGEVPHVGALQLINAMTQENSSKGELLFVSVKLNGQNVKAMIDTGATNNFIAEDCAARCGLPLVKDKCRVKAVNSEAQPVAGVAKSVDLVVGDWHGKVDLVSFSMVDYDLVLGVDWISKAQVMVAPHLRGMLIAGDPIPCFVLGTSGPEKSGSVERVSALVLVESQEEGDETSMASLEKATLIEKGTLSDGSEMMHGNALCMVAEDVLDTPEGEHIGQAVESTNVLTRSPIPKVLASSELSERRKKLNAELGVRIIQPDKTPCGNSVQFQWEHEGSKGLCGGHNFNIKCNLFFPCIMMWFIIVLNLHFVVLGKEMGEHDVKLKWVFEGLNACGSCNFAKEGMFLEHCIALGWVFLYATKAIEQVMLRLQWHGELYMDAIQVRDAVLMSLEQARCCSLICHHRIDKRDKFAKLVKVLDEEVLGGILLIPCTSGGSCKIGLELDNLYPGQKQVGPAAVLEGAMVGVVLDLEGFKSNQHVISA